MFDCNAYNGELIYIYVFVNYKKTHSQNSFMRKVCSLSFSKKFSVCVMCTKVCQLFVYDTCLCVCVCVCVVAGNV